MLFSSFYEWGTRGSVKISDLPWSDGFGTRTQFSCLPLCMISHSVVSHFLWPYGLYSPPGSSVRSISQAGILEWVAISFSRWSSRPRHQTPISCIGRWILYHCTAWGCLYEKCSRNWESSPRKKGRLGRVQSICSRLHRGRERDFYNM